MPISAMPTRRRGGLLSAFALAALISFTPPTPAAAQVFEYQRPEARMPTVNGQRGSLRRVIPCVEGGRFNALNRCSSAARETAARAFCREAGHERADRTEIEFAPSQYHAVLDLRRGAQFLRGGHTHAFRVIRCSGGTPDTGFPPPTSAGVELTPRRTTTSTRATGTTTWGTQSVPFLSSVPARCARGGFAAGVAVAATRPLVGSPLVGRFGLICDHPTTADYTVDFGDRNLGLVSYRCPRGFHLWEVQGRSGLAIDRISQIRCRRVDSRGQVETRTVRVSAGGLGGDAVYVRCSSANGFLRVTIFKNIAIDKLTWGCAVRS